MNKKGFIYAVSSAVIFGFMPLFTKIIYSMGAGSVSAGFYRVSLSLFTILIIQLLLKNKKKRTFCSLLILSI